MSDEAAPEFLSKSAYAAHRGVTPAMVTRWTGQARIVLTPDGKRVDVAASDALLAKSLDPGRGGRGGRSDRIHPRQAAREAGGGGDYLPSPSAAAIGGADYAAVRTTRESYRAKTEELEYLQRVGTLVVRAEYDRALEDGLAPCLAALDTLSARLGPGLAAEQDVRRVQNMLDRAMVDIRQDIADTFRRMIAGGGTVTQ